MWKYQKEHLQTSRGNVRHNHNDEIDQWFIGAIDICVVCMYMTVYILQIMWFHESVNKKIDVKYNYFVQYVYRLYFPSFQTRETKTSMLETNLYLCYSLLQWAFQSYTGTIVFAKIKQTLNLTLQESFPKFHDSFTNIIPQNTDNYIISIYLLSFQTFLQCGAKFLVSWYLFRIICTRYKVRGIIYWQVNGYKILHSIRMCSKFS